MTKDETVEEIVASFENLILACEHDVVDKDLLEGCGDILRRYRDRKETKIPTTRFMAFWNSTPPLCMIQAMSADRRQHLGQRAQEDFFVHHWQEGIQRIAKSSFCLGKNDRGWKATVDWFLRPGTLVKIMEGTYDNRGPVGIVRKNSVVHTESMVNDAKKWRDAQQAENDGLPAF